jgi:hypothetical protein
VEVFLNIFEVKIDRGIVNGTFSRYHFTTHTFYQTFQNLLFGGGKYLKILLFLILCHKCRYDFLEEGGRH